MHKAGVIVDHAPPLVDHVIHERHSLDRAFQMADTIRRAKPTEKDAERATLGKEFQDAMAAVFEHETKSNELDAAFNAAYKKYFGPSKPPKKKIAESIRCGDIARSVYIIGHHEMNVDDFDPTALDMGLAKYLEADELRKAHKSIEEIIEWRNRYDNAR
jgi:hypothetical protein